MTDSRLCFSPNLTNLLEYISVALKQSTAKNVLKKKKKEKEMNQREYQGACTVAGDTLLAIISGRQTGKIMIKKGV